jgi:hypothetical protein
LTFFIETLAEYGTLENFGIDRVAFNTKLTLAASQIAGPVDWAVSADSQLNGFGNFSWNVQKQKGPDRLNPVVVTITDLGTGAIPANFLVLSTQKNGKAPPQGATVFAAHVAGFSGTEANNFTDGHFIGDDPPRVTDSPEPSSLVLLGLGLGGLGLARLRWQRSRRPRPA